MDGNVKLRNVLAGGTALAQVWVFLIAPCMGAAAAAVVWNCIYATRKE